MTSSSSSSSSSWITPVAFAAAGAATALAVQSLVTSNNKTATTTTTTPPPKLEMMESITVGGQELKNRIVLAPMTRARCENTQDPFDKHNSLPNDLMVEYYTQRASAGLIITEATAISEEGAGWRNAPHIRTMEEALAWKKIVDSVHNKGAIIYLQLWHQGRQAHSSHHPTTKRTVSAGNIPMQGQKMKTIHNEDVEAEIPHSLTKDEIQQTIQDYVKACELAKVAGFDGVEIHAANGYLIDQFLQSSSNNRTDEYGGSMENRTRFLREVVEAIIQIYPVNRIGFRLSPNGKFGGMGSEDNDVMFPYVAKAMNEYGLAYMHVMDGLGFGFHEKCRRVTVHDMKKEFTHAPIIANVGLTKDVAEGMLRSGATDMVCFGRLFISNPDLPERFANNYPVEPEAAYKNFWYPTGAKGYTDYPTYSK